MKRRIAEAIEFALCTPVLMGMTGCGSTRSNSDTQTAIPWKQIIPKAAPLPKKIPDNPDAAAVRINQVGYLPDMPKVAVVVDGGRTFTVKKADTDETVYTGVIKKGSFDFASGDNINYADFSALCR